MQQQTLKVIGSGLLGLAFLGMVAGVIVDLPAVFASVTGVAVLASILFVGLGTALSRSEKADELISSIVVKFDRS